MFDRSDNRQYSYILFGLLAIVSSFARIFSIYQNDTFVLGLVLTSKRQHEHFNKAFDLFLPKNIRFETRQQYLRAIKTTSLVV
jgi:hypothetical protein